MKKVQINQSMKHLIYYISIKKQKDTKSSDKYNSSTSIVKMLIYKLLNKKTVCEY